MAQAASSTDDREAYKRTSTMMKNNSLRTEAKQKIYDAIEILKKMKADDQDDDSLDGYSVLEIIKPRSAVLTFSATSLEDANKSGLLDLLELILGKLTLVSQAMDVPGLKEERDIEKRKTIERKKQREKKEKEKQTDETLKAIVSMSKRTKE
jgi:hypothetical protein